MYYTKKSKIVFSMFVLAMVQLTLVGCSGKEESPLDPSMPETFKLPEIQTALKTQEEIEKRRIILCSYHKNIDDTVTRCVDSRPKSYGKSFTKSSLTTIEQLIGTTHQLRIAAREILAQKDEYLAALHAFKDPVYEAPSELRKAAELFREFAQESEYKAFQEDYLVMAEIFDSLAKHYDEQQYELYVAFNEDEYLKNMAYLEACALMLDRFEASLIIAKASHQQISKMEKHLANLQNFIKAFEDFRSQIRRVRKLLDEPSPGLFQNSPKWNEKDDEEKNDGIYSVA